eukprot:GHVQ01015037.1.p1 GENE.GHVQ01015037.1~~GHVQ01015037.1.p1  ORF type:complete len:256 (+),score=20.42 GHVQ01015037.1:73-768(+)
MFASVTRGFPSLPNSLGVPVFQQFRRIFCTSPLFHQRVCAHFSVASPFSEVLYSSPRLACLQLRSVTSGVPNGGHSVKVANGKEPVDPDREDEEKDFLKKPPSSEALDSDRTSTASNGVVEPNTADAGSFEGDLHARYFQMEKDYQEGLKKVKEIQDKLLRSLADQQNDRARFQREVSRLYCMCDYINGQCLLCNVWAAGELPKIRRNKFREVYVGSGGHYEAGYEVCGFE